MLRSVKEYYGNENKRDGKVWIHVSTRALG
jgi:hypothetical protein